MSRTEIPAGGTNKSVAEHNLQDFRPYHMTRGNIWFVDSGVSASGNGLSPDGAVSTIDAAINLCTASQLDTIYVCEGHAETISTSTGLVMDVAGVDVIGLGRGTLRPKLTLSASASTISITGASCSLSNIHLFSSFTGGVIAGITVGAAADGLVLNDIEMTETAATEEWLIGISIATLCTEVAINRFRYKGTAGGTTSSAIYAAGAADGLVIRDSYIHGDFSGAAVDYSVSASTDVELYDNRIINIDTGAGLGLAAHASSTGFVARNVIANLKDTVKGVSGAGMAYCENYGTNALNAQGTVALALAVDT